MYDVEGAFLLPDTGGDSALVGGAGTVEWIWDSGAKRHYTVQRYPGFRRLPAHSQPTIGTAGAGTLRGKEVGDLLASSANQLDLLGCMYTPGLTHNLVSTGVMCDSTDYDYLHTSDGVFAVPKGDVYVDDCLKVADRGAHTGRMYLVNPDCFNINGRNSALYNHCAELATHAGSSLEYAAFMRGMNPAQAFHLANGHPSKDRMRLILTHGLVEDPGYTFDDLDAWVDPCHGCEMGKAKRTPHLGSHSLDEEMAAEVVIYMDNFGKTQTPSLGGNHYAAIFVARRSKWTWVELLKHERDMPEVVDQWLGTYYSLCGHLPSVLFSDGASVNTSAAMDSVLAKRMVARKRSVPHNSEQNPAEVYIRVLTTIARCNLKPLGGRSTSGVKR